MVASDWASDFKNTTCTQQGCFALTQRAHLRRLWRRSRSFGVPLVVIANSFLRSLTAGTGTMSCRIVALAQAIGLGGVENALDAAAQPRGGLRLLFPNRIKRGWRARRSH